LPTEPKGVLTAVDLFAGCGGASLGFRNAGFEVRAAVELDPIAASTYSANHTQVTPLVGDIRQFPASLILQSARLQKGECTVVLGCPPCQGFSTHRLHGSGSDDPRNELVEVFAERVIDVRPLFFVFENVPGLMRQTGSPWPAVRAKLCESGYRVVEDLLNAADYGAPQRRKRLVAVGCRMEGVDPTLPEPTHGKPKPDRPSNGVKHPWLTVRDAIENLKTLANGETSGDPLHYAPKHTDDSLARFAAIPKDGGSRRELPENLKLKCHSDHEGHRDVYGRLWWDKPATTITAGCTQPSKGRFLHPEQDRGLTLREAARLQGFPDSYVFTGSKQEIALQIGNAVPPPLAYAVGLAIRRMLSPVEALSPEERPPQREREVPQPQH